jgi:hypothetical protein
MPTTIVKTIGTGGDYSTLQAWEDACPANLVTADQIWQGQCKNQEFALNATVLNIAGTTTDATRYIELTTEAGASFRDHASKATNALRYDATKGAGIRATNAYGKPIWVQVAHTRISNLQVQNHSTSNNTALTIAVTSCLIRDSIFEGWASTIGMGDVNTLVNVVAIKRAAGGNIIGATYGVNAYNCTLVVPSDVSPATNGISGAYGGKTANLKNTAIFGATTAVNLAATKVITTCVTDQAAPLSGFTTQTYANCFENSTAGAADFRLKAGSPLINAGTTDATYGVNDIIGTARASFDIGVWEYVAGSTDATAPGATLTGTSSISAGSAIGGSGGTDATAPGATLTGTSSISAGSASGSGGVGTFTSDAMENNTGAGLLVSTSVTWTWWQGAIGATPTSLTHGTGTTSAGGILSLTGLPTGAGFLIARTADSAGVYYQPGTVT